MLAPVRSSDFQLFTEFKYGGSFGLRSKDVLAADDVGHRTLLYIFQEYELK
ncbi:MAG: hypothetical protein ACOH2A_15115 [Sphingobacteriaceae bacterium]